MLRLVERHLDRRRGGLGELLDAHPDQTDAGALQAEGVVELTGQRRDVAGDVGGIAKGAGARDRREVGEAHLDAHRPPDEAGGPQPGGRLVREREQGAVDDLGVVDVVVEGALVADGALAADRLDDAARAGWLYYIAGRTQDEIAVEMGVSRQVAQRLVSLAVDARLILPASGGVDLQDAMAQGPLDAIYLELHGSQFSHTAMQKVLDGSLDVAIGRWDFIPSELRCSVVGREEVMVVLPSNHPLADAPRVEMSQLAEESWVILPRHHPRR